MKKLLTNLLIGGVLLLAAWFLGEKSSTMVSGEKVENAEELCKNSTEIMGALQIEKAKEVTLEIGSSEIVTYELPYKYNVGGKDYEATHEVKNLETGTLPTRKLWYAKSNPELATFSEPCAELESITKGKTVGNEMLYLIPALLLGLIGISLAWGGIKGFIVGLFKGNKKEEA